MRIGSSWLTQIHLRSLKQIRWSLQTLIDSSLLMQTDSSWLTQIHLRSLMRID